MTAQIHERLIYEGEETSMAFCPPLPADHPRIVELDPEVAAQGSSEEDGIFFSTACWRGYQGTWQVEEGRLYLLELRGRLRLLGDGPLLADWFSGVLRIPRGKELLYVHMGFGSVYEEELQVKIDRGQVVATRVIDNRGKEFDESELAWRNMPGGENRFEGDEEW